MENTDILELEHHVITAARDYGNSITQFRIAFAQKLHLNITDTECLELLFFKGSTTPTALAQFTGLSSGATTAMLDRLEKSKCIKRSPNPKDRRGKLIHLEKKFRNAVEPLFTRVKDEQAALVSRYSKQELALITGFLQHYTAAWELGQKELLK